MCRELSVYTPTRTVRVFLQNGFYAYSPSAKNHLHNYTELHLILDGNAAFTVDDREISAESGTMLIIPKKTPHACTKEESGVKHTAFQLDLDTAAFALHHIDENLLRLFFEEIAHARSSDDYAPLSAMMALLLCLRPNAERVSAKKVTDYRFLINEFFSLRYNEDVHLADLASLLHLSERQAERLVRTHMGCSFREALTNARIATAHRLLKASTLSGREVAEYVGYRSYTGFWKAMKKYGLLSQKNIEVKAKL